MKKSQLRINAEATLATVNLTPYSEAVWIDHGKLASRIKFGCVHPTQETVDALKAPFAALYPGVRTDVVLVKSKMVPVESNIVGSLYHTIGGVAFKVYK